MGGAKGYLATAGLRGAGCHWSRAETTIARSGNALTLQVVPEATHNVSAATFADLMGKVVATSASVMGQAALSVIEQVGEDGKEAVRTRKARAEHMATLVQLQGPEQERQELASPPLSAGLFGLGLASVVAVEPLAMLTAGAAALAARCEQASPAKLHPPAHAQTCVSSSHAPTHTEHLPTPHGPRQRKASQRPSEPGAIPISACALVRLQVSHRASDR